MAGGGDPFDLDRFVAAQAPVYADVVAELRRGRKDSHWMWFVFPQVRGLGRSATAEHFAIATRAEAAAYLAHPVLGSRLVECAGLLLAHSGRPIRDILGTPDDLKLGSSMTLFEAVAADPTPFAAVLVAFYAGARDAATLRLLGA